MYFGLHLVFIALHRLCLVWQGGAALSCGRLPTVVASLVEHRL